METSNFTTTVLTASKGMYLTQNSDGISAIDRLITTTISLGKNDSPDNYKEITEEEAEVIRNEKAVALQALREKMMNKNF